MTDPKHLEFIQAAQNHESLKDKYVESCERMEALMKEIGLDTYVQDPVSLTVYKIHKPNGTFVYYKDIDYKRTAKEGEKGGTVLSKKEAEEAGFTLKK
jgi:hypothetical protein